MNHHQKDILPLSVKEALSSQRYIIPIYQRNYAWSAPHIEQLIEDVLDSIDSENYYIGSLVVSEEEDCFVTVDGQQRLTTLSILCSVLKNNFKCGELFDWFADLNLEYTSRPKAKRTLDVMHNNGEFTESFVGEDHTESAYDNGIKAACSICKQAIKTKLEEKRVDINSFVDFLLNKVKIVRVCLPKKIDLNHYFEIMNSRGEQLEKQERVKASLMKVFEGDVKKEKYFDLIWTNCSNMEKYIQTGFSPNQRDAIFGKDNWDNFKIDSFEHFCSKLAQIEENEEIIIGEDSHQSIDEIINSTLHPIKQDKTQNSNSEQFGSVVNFANFLLHALRIYTKSDIPLDDKQLIIQFEKKLKNDPKNFSKEFIFSLLKQRFLFDKYIIKRENDKDNWSLKRMACSERNLYYANTFSDSTNHVVMLLSMFHVSLPSMLYKHWLSAAMYYVYTQEEVVAEDYIKYLEHIAKKFVFDRYLSQNDGEYYNLIFENDEPLPRDIDQSRLVYGDIKNNLVFNFTDYLLWLEVKNGNRLEPDVDLQKIKDFKFTFRSSVEHYYPQHPLEGIDELDGETLNSFGNLCLISHEKNSKLSNHTPRAKKDYYIKQNSIDSIKQFLMMSYSNWNKEQIKVHHNYIIDLLRKNQISGYQWCTHTTPLSKKIFDRYKEEDINTLVRALLCFGEVETLIGSTCGIWKMDFYNFLQDKENKEDLYKRFSNFINENNFEDLKEVIKYKLTNDSELKHSYRYSFITRPELLDYCSGGLFGCNQEGTYFLLLERQRATGGRCVDLYFYCLKLEIEKRFNILVNCSHDSLKCTLKVLKEQVVLTDYDYESKFSLEFFYKTAYSTIACQINAKGMRSSNRELRFIRKTNLQENKKLFYLEDNNELQITTNTEFNIRKLSEMFDKIADILNLKN